MLTKLEHASPQDANIACFLCRKPITKVVIIINKLLTSAFASILRALQVRHRLTRCMLALVSAQHFNTQEHVKTPQFHSELCLVGT